MGIIQRFKQTIHCWENKNMRKGQKIMIKKLGIGIISWNRPNYLKQLLNSLEKNDLSDCNFHLLQDGFRCKFTNNIVADPKDISQSIKLFNDSKLPNKEFHIQEKNVSVAINQFEAMQILCKNYRYFIFLENDVIVSPNFIVVMKNLLKQFEHDKRVSCISPNFRLFCKKKEIKQNIDRLTFFRGHFWAEACWTKKWKIIEKEYMPYYNLVKNQPYEKRDEMVIKDLFNNSGMKMLTTSQDQGKDWAIMKSGMKRIRLVVNRATGIGDKGIHSTPGKLKATRDGHNKIYTFEEELKIKEFKIR